LPVFWALSLRWFKVVDDAMPPLPRKLPQNENSKNRNPEL